MAFSEFFRNGFGIGARQKPDARNELFTFDWQKSKRGSGSSSGKKGKKDEGDDESSASSRGSSRLTTRRPGDGQSSGKNSGRGRVQKSTQRRHTGDLSDVSDDTEETTTHRKVRHNGVQATQRKAPKSKSMPGTSSSSSEKKVIKKRKMDSGKEKELRIVLERVQNKRKEPKDDTGTDNDMLSDRETITVNVRRDSIFDSSDSESDNEEAPGVPDVESNGDGVLLEETNEEESRRRKIRANRTVNDGNKEKLVHFMIEEDGVNYNKLANSEITKNEIVVPEALTKPFASFLTPDVCSRVEEFPGVSVSITSASNSLKVGYMKIRSKTVRPMDCLENVNLLYWVISGTVTFRSTGGYYKSPNGQSRYLFGKSLTKGSCVVIPESTCYTIENWGKQEALLGYSVMVPPESVNSVRD